ncbi:MAG TPA: DNA polymerase IV [Gemmatimonadales bacterium]
MSARRILLADADAFYVSVARLVDPEGAGKAPLLIVGGTAEGRGVVTSASYEARRFGVTSAMPTARALRLCPGATVVPVPWEACVEKSHAIREVLGKYAPVVEAASQDECYLEMSGTERLYKDEPLADTARRMREAVLAETQISVSIGGGTSKLIAKMAATMAKPGGIHVVDAGGEQAFMRRFQLADLPFVGPRFQERLGRFNLKSVDEALAAGADNLRAWLGDREGLWLWTRIHGEDEARVERNGDNKSISRDETFGVDIDDDDVLRGELIKLVDRAASDLRESELLARTVTVRLRDHDFVDRQASRTVEAPVISDRAVLRVARELLLKLRRARPVPARLLGVGLSSLVRSDRPGQLSLIAEPQSETEKDRAVARVVDELRRKLGDEAVALGRAPTHRRR